MVRCALFRLGVLCTKNAGSLWLRQDKEIGMPELNSVIPVLIGGMLLGAIAWGQLNKPVPVEVREKKRKR